MPTRSGRTGTTEESECTTFFNDDDGGSRYSRYLVRARDSAVARRSSRERRSPQANFTGVLEDRTLGLHLK